MIQRRVMVVEDERIVALNLQQQLTELGYEVAGDGDLAASRRCRRIERACSPTWC